MQPLGIKLAHSPKYYDKNRPIALSQLNLLIRQVKSSKTGGPYTDLLSKPSKEAKRDSRLKNSGPLKCYNFSKTYWSLYPPTLFYDWLYINALSKHKKLASEITQYIAFTDIEFNPIGRLIAKHIRRHCSSHEKSGVINRPLSSKNKLYRTHSAIRRAR